MRVKHTVRTSFDSKAGWAFMVEPTDEGITVTLNRQGEDDLTLEMSPAEAYIMGRNLLSDVEEHHQDKIDQRIKTVRTAWERLDADESV